MEKCAKLCARFSWETIAIPLEKYDNTVEITLLVLYLFLGIVGKYYCNSIGNHGSDMLKTCYNNIGNKMIITK